MARRAPPGITTPIASRDRGFLLIGCDSIEYFTISHTSSALGAD